MSLIAFSSSFPSLCSCQTFSLSYFFPWSFYFRLFGILFFLSLDCPFYSWFFCFQFIMLYFCFCSLLFIGNHCLMKKLDHSKQSIIKHQLLAIKYQLTAISYQLFTFSYYLLQLLFSVPLDVMACPHLGEPPNKNCIGMLTVPLFFLGGSPSCPHLAETSSKNNTNTHTHINTHTQTQTHTHKYTHTHKSTHTHTHTHIHTHKCIFVYVIWICWLHAGLQIPLSPLYSATFHAS